jgi:hypothetical protein
MFSSRLIAAMWLMTSLLTIACKKENNSDDAATPNLIFIFRFDSTQARLDSLGRASVIPNGNAAQSGKMNQMSAHYIELTPTAFDSLGKGAVIYRAPETIIGGSNAIDFEKAAKAGNGEEFFRIPMKDVKPGTYEWIRISLAYQNGDVKVRVDTTINNFPINQDIDATLASFIGFNNYIKSFRIKDSVIAVNGNRKQGYWGFETRGININGKNYASKDSGQAPSGATTVVNPLFASSPIPQGSCVVTAAFKDGKKLTVTGNETRDIIIECSFSTNKSIEWLDPNDNGKWEPLKGERLVDMGIRGLIPTIK